MERKPEEIRQELQDKVSRCNMILRELENNQGFRAMLEDFNKTRMNIDNNWQFIFEPDKLQEMRVTKMAVMSILNMLESYEHDKNTAAAKLVELDNEDKIISGDFDNG